VVRFFQSLRDDAPHRRLVFHNQNPHGVASVRDPTKAVKALSGDFHVCVIELSTLCPPRCMAYER
jgi:hypothetical protein